ncbi:MAG: ATP-dependent Clp protease adaptor ClpS [Saprospiraceae bacterium]
MQPHNGTQYEEDEDVLVLDEVDTDDPAQILVYNDDHNTFDWVVKSFQEILGHSPEQGEQLAMLIHFKGKASVKSGSMPELRPLREGLTDRGLSAVIEKVDA